MPDHLPAEMASAHPMLERAEGRVALTVARRGQSSAIADLAQRGCGRLLFPLVTSAGASRACSSTRPAG